MKNYIYASFIIAILSLSGYIKYQNSLITNHEQETKISEVKADIIEQYQQVERDKLDEKLEDINANIITKINDIEEFNYSNSSSIWLFHYTKPEANNTKITNQ